MQTAGEEARDPIQCLERLAALQLPDPRVLADAIEAHRRANQWYISATRRAARARSHALAREVAAADHALAVALDNLTNNLGQPNCEVAGLAGGVKELTGEARRLRSALKAWLVPFTRLGSGDASLARTQLAPSLEAAAGLMLAALAELKRAAAAALESRCGAG